MSQVRTLIHNGDIVTPEGVISGGWLLLENGLIREIGSSSDPLPEGAGETVDAGGGWVLPGFIDIHVHGGYGHDFMDAGREGLDAITRFHASHGTTTMLATTVTASKEAIDGVLERVADYRSGDMPYAQLAGVHLEGPFISVKWPGAQNPAFIVPPQTAWLDDWTSRYPGLVRMQTLAPETDGALDYIRALVQHGIVAACGHTDALYAQVQAAADSGLSHAVHTFNAMRGLHHREPGTVGAVLTDERITAEVIADGHHVHAAGVRLLAQAKGDRGLVLITDAISAAGLGDGDYSLGGLDVVVRSGVARLKQGDSLAGSTLTMDAAFRFAVREAGVSVPAASRMASGNPARVLGLSGVTGELAAGKQADALLLSRELELQRVWIRGRAHG
ncbi:N-acetylglucosamine-6-phosphate deacetylase [Paenibacillus sp. GD4]|uniref:N-acetylglucosamine-6-phosphate deacetylase n=1 Tax=Paenibacillus sp. GD4 TaxID=3068890 RepID=UPI002796D0A2|nr:N-acetylglucosamine-6-phosphate deacetylase [Paenibacillus sp. GD4]MDQ1909621.1 N-acetylglucosamine-6-phosphate deacetylase [Paenibacillus sp. GD4]